MTELTKELLNPKDIECRLTELDSEAEHAKHLTVYSEASMNRMNFRIAINSDVHLLTGWDVVSGVDDPEICRAIVYTDK